MRSWNKGASDQVFMTLEEGDDGERTEAANRKYIHNGIRDEERHTICAARVL